MSNLRFADAAREAATKALGEAGPGTYLCLGLSSKGPPPEFVLVIETTKQVSGPEFTFDGFRVRFGLYVSEYLRGNHVVDYDPARHLSFVTGSDQKWHGSFAVTPDGTWVGGFVVHTDEN